MLMFKGPSITRYIMLHQNNGLYYCNAIKYDIYQEQRDKTEWVDDNTPVAKKTTTKNNLTQSHVQHTRKGIPKTAKYQPTTTAKILKSETWSMRLGACHKNTTQVIAQPCYWDTKRL